MANRISEALSARNGGNQSEMARYVGVSPQAVQKWVAGESEPRGENLKKAAEFLGVSEVFLKFGADLASQNPDGTWTLLQFKHSPNPSRRPLFGREVMALDDMDDVADVVRVRRVKLHLSAGISGFSTEPEVEDDFPITFRRQWLESRGYFPENLIAIKVKGQSMEPGLYEGDTVVVNTADTKPKDGAVYAVNFEGEAVIKRLIREIGFWWLSSDNPDKRRYPNKRCEGEMCIIIGRVIHKQSEQI